MRLLVGAGDPSTAAGLRNIYEPPRRPWLRANMVHSVDGAATGHDGRTASVNSPVDREVFQLLRRLADVILVGAGTVRAERYGPGGTPIVIVSGRGDVPVSARGGEPGAIRLATTAAAPLLDEARQLLGEEHVYVVGGAATEPAVDLQELLGLLHDQGLTHVLCEGGATLLGDLLRADLVDELCHTTTPRLLAGDAARILNGPGVDVPLSLHTLLEEDGTLLARWLIER